MTAPATGNPVILSGTPYERGAQQAKARPDAGAQVRQAVHDRIAQAAGGRIGLPRARVMLADMIAYAAEHAPDSLAEARGIADGFAIPEDVLLEYLHVPVLLDVARGGEGHDDGCSAWAAPGGGGGAWLAKNRDYGGNHLAIQRVFRHEGGDLKAGPLLCVGSLGAPGAFSSGMNAHGLALADTQVATSDHGPGLSRYFLMTELLRRCRSVAEALAYVGSVRHAGGGCLILGDASGRVAAAELGWQNQAVELADTGGWVRRTNHHLAPPLAGRLIEPAAGPAGANSRGRLAYLTASLAAAVPLAEPEAFAQSLMASHDSDAAPGGIGLCQHGDDGLARTISSVLYDTAARRLTFQDGLPCQGPRATYAL